MTTTLWKNDETPAAHDLRAKVACLPGAAGGDRYLASTRLEPACRHLDDARVRLLLIGGSPGTGKTTVSAALAASMDAVVLSSDAVRKELAGVAKDVPMPAAYGAGIYSPQWSARTYDKLLVRAQHNLEMGRSVILDATWASAEQRASAARLAERTLSDLGQSRCELPDSVADERIAARHSLSDADHGIAAEIRARFADWPEAVPIDTATSVDAAVADLLHRLQPWRTAPQIARPRMVPD